MNFLIKIFASIAFMLSVLILCQEHKDWFQYFSAGIGIAIFIDAIIYLAKKP